VLPGTGETCGTTTCDDDEWVWEWAYCDDCYAPNSQEYECTQCSGNECYVLAKLISYECESGECVEAPPAYDYREEADHHIITDCP